MESRKFWIALVFLVLCIPTINAVPSPPIPGQHSAIDFGIYDFVPPCPDVRQFTQPDGTAFEGKVRGMEIGGGVETLDGHVAVMDSKGWWTYSTSKSDGVSQASSARVGIDPQPATLASSRGGSDSVWLDERGIDSRDGLFASFQETNEASAVVKYVVVMVEFQATGIDDRFQVGHDQVYFENLLNGTGGNPTGTMTEFYVENSYGAFTPWFDVVGPFRVAGAAADYAPTDSTFMTLALQAADPTVNFASYNHDFVIFIHAGPDQSATSNPAHIWSFATTLNYVADGITIVGGCCGPEIGTNIGVFCHEMGHTLGCPDYYDTTYTTEGTGEWEVMAGGSWLGHPAGSNPPHFNPYSKYVTLGWLTPTMISATTKGAILNHYELTPTSSVIRVQLSTSEWFYFQYVNNTCAHFNRYLHNSGLVIWHYDANGVQSNPNRMRLAVEEWDYLDGSQELRLKKNRGEPTDPFHDDPTGMTPITTPNTYAGSGTNYGWSFCNISARGTTMTFDLLRPLTTYAELSAGIPYVEAAPPLLNGTTVTLSSYIFNSGNKAASSVKVKFFDGVPGSGGVQIGANVTIATLAAYAKTKTSVSWTAQPHGPHDIYVQADPDNTVAEAANTNNVQHGIINVWPRNAPILLVDDDCNFELQASYEAALTALGYPYVKVINNASLAVMNRYEIVIWLTGANRVAGALNTTEIANIKSFLGTGKCAWFASPRLSSALGSTNTYYPGVDSAFLSTYLGATYSSTVMTNMSWANGTGDAIGGTNVFKITDAPLTRAQSDTMAVATGATSSMSSSYGLQYAVKKDSGTWKTVFFGFDLTQVVGAANQTLLTQRVLDWFRMSTVDFSKERYNSEDTVQVTVHDTDLTGSVTVNVKSAAEPAGESVVCTQVSAGTFQGTITISETDAVGVLHVAPGANINATYTDASPSKVRWALAYVCTSTSTAWFKIPVVAGWNFISTPLAPASTSLPAALADSNGDTTWTRAMWYDPLDTADHWKQYNTAWGAGLNDLKSVDAKMGVWVYVSVVGDGFLNVSGAQPTSTAINLRAGWNIVGFPSDDTVYTVAMLQAQCPSVTMVERFNAANPPYMLSAITGATALAQGRGYWVYATADAVWTVAW